MNLIKHIRVGIALLAIVASASPVYAAYFTHPNASGTNPRPAPAPYNATQHTYQYGQDQQGFFPWLASQARGLVQGAKKQVQGTTDNVKQMRENDSLKPTVEALKRETHESSKQFQECGNDLKGMAQDASKFLKAAPMFFCDIAGSLWGKTDITEFKEGIASESNCNGKKTQNGKFEWIKKGEAGWFETVTRSAGEQWLDDIVKPKLQTNGSYDLVKCSRAAIPALLGLVVFKEEIAGAVKAVARKLLPKRFFQEKPATGISFKDLSPEQQKYVQSQMGNFGTPSRPGYPAHYGRGVQQNAFQQYELDAKASQLYQKGWWGYSRKR